MFRYRLRELIAERTFQSGRPVPLTEIAEETGIARRVLTSIANERGYNTATDTLDKLCTYFGCRIEQLMEHVPDAPAGEGQAVKKGRPGDRAAKAPATGLSQRRHKG